MILSTVDTPSATPPPGGVDRVVGRNLSLSFFFFFFSPFFLFIYLSPLETMNFTPLHKIVKEVREFIFRYFTLKK